jgi:hypothetical protein
MAGLFSDHYNFSHDRIGILYSVANDLCEVGYPVLDFWLGPFALRPVPNENDLDLFSTERQGRWDLKFRLPF